MDIIATAQLAYRDGKSISSGYERLELYVKFREKRKIFKTKLHRNLVSTYQVLNAHLSLNPLHSYADYYNECEKYLNDINLVKDVAEFMIRDHFNKKDNNTYKENKSKELQNKVSKLGKIEVKVKLS
jgi:hypothetical protein